MRRINISTFILISGLLLYSACAKPEIKVSLKSKYDKLFMIGTAISDYQLLEKETNTLELISNEFNALTPENLLKWEKVHPSPEVYKFAPVDRFVKFSTEHDMHMVGHTLVWHQQTPDWVFEKEDGTLRSREELITILKDHIFTVVGKYKGIIDGWDVVNEIFEDSGEIRKTKWYEILGLDYVNLAFQYAAEADPEAKLFYNDYNLWMKPKREATLKLLTDLKNEGVKITGIGIQAHWSLQGPTIGQIDSAIIDISKAGFDCMFTELDVNVLPNPWDYQGADISKEFDLSPETNPYVTELPEDIEMKQAVRYNEIFNLFRKHSNSISRITFWGVHDGFSWKNNWPVKGRTDYPLLFDRKGMPKKAYYKVIDF